MNRIHSVSLGISCSWLPMFLQPHESMQQLMQLKPCLATFLLPQEDYKTVQERSQTRCSCSMLTTTLLLEPLSISSRSHQFKRLYNTPWPVLQPFLMLQSSH